MALTYLRNISYKLYYTIDFFLAQILLFSNPSFDANDTTKMINLTINYALSTKRFDGVFYKELLSYFFSFLDRLRNGLDLAHMLSNLKTFNKN